MTELKTGQLLDPIKAIEDVPDDCFNSEIILLHKRNISPEHFKLIQRELKNILGSNYYRSFLQQ